MLTDTQYAEARTICDKANAYWKANATFSKSGWSSMSKELSAHPDYAACTNAMRGQVELYELNRDKPAVFSAYVRDDNAKSEITTWTGDTLGHVTYSGPKHTNNFGARWHAVTVRTIWGETYHGRYYFDAGQLVNLRRSRA